MIDLVLHALTKADLRNWAAARNLFRDDGEGGKVPIDGLSWCWWAESGKLMTAKGTYDAEGNEITPPTFLAGVVGLLRIADQTDEISEGSEQWERSQIAKAIKTNGTPGTQAGLPYYEWDGVRLFRYSDVFQWLAANDLPGHIYLGGNYE